MEVKRSKNGRSVSGRGKAPNGGAGRAEPSLLEEASSLIAMLRENKVEIFEKGDFKIKMSILAFVPEVTSNEKNPSSTVEDTDELLFYSSPGRPA